MHSAVTYRVIRLEVADNELQQAEVVLLQQFRVLSPKLLSMHYTPSIYVLCMLVLGVLV